MANTENITLTLNRFTDVRMEQCTVKCLLRYGDRVYSEVADILKAEHFSDAELGALYSAISERMNSGKPIDVTLIAGEAGISLKNIEMFLNDKSCFVTEYGISEYAHRVIDCWKLRELNSHLLDVLKTVNADEDEDADKLASYAQGELQSIDVADRDYIKDALIVAAGLLDEYRKNKTPQNKVIPTGLEELDDVLGGGLYEGTLNIIGARPGVGKSALGMQIILNMLKAEKYAYPMLIFSIEMDAKQVVNRSFSAFSSVAVSRLQCGGVPEPTWSLISDSIKKIYAHTKDEAPRLLICEKSSLTLDDIRSVVASVRMKYGGVSCIMLDYLQLVNVSTQNQTRAQALGEVSRTLKEFARDCHIPVIAQCQLKREVDSRRSMKLGFGFKASDSDDTSPTNADIKDSGNIEQDADCIIMLKRVENSRELVTAYITKNRNGIAGDGVSVDMLFRGEACSFFSAREIKRLDEIYQEIE